MRQVGIIIDEIQLVSEIRNPYVDDPEVDDIGTVLLSF